MDLVRYKEEFVDYSKRFAELGLVKVISDLEAYPTDKLHELLKESIDDFDNDPQFIDDNVKFYKELHSRFGFVKWEQFIITVLAVRVLEKIGVFDKELIVFMTFILDSEFKKGGLQIIRDKNVTECF